MPLNSIRRRDDHLGAIRGFSLTELLLALSLGIGLSGTILQLLISESDLGLRVNRLLRERGVQERTLALIRDDVERASRISSTPQLEQHACSLAGRLPVLHLSTVAGPITYSVGAAPSAIWRGQVLMRCGPAFGLNGEPSPNSQSQNRVLLDGLAVAPQPWSNCNRLLPAGGMALDLAGSSARGVSACYQPTTGLLALRLEQDFVQGPRRSLVTSEKVMSGQI